MPFVQNDSNTPANSAAFYDVAGNQINSNTKTNTNASNINTSNSTVNRSLEMEEIDNINTGVANVASRDTRQT